MSSCLTEHSLKKEINHRSYRIRSFIPHMFEFCARRQTDGEKGIREILEETKYDSQASSISEQIDGESVPPFAGVQVVDS